MDTKWERTKSAIGTLRSKIEEWQPDALIVFGDDQEECFDFRNHPSLAVYLGRQFSGFAPGTPSPARDGGVVPDHVSVPGHPDLARIVTYGLLERDFDPAFMMELPKPGVGMSHSVMNVIGFFTDYNLPAVPILLNAYFAPQMTARRARLVGRAVRAVLDRCNKEMSVALIASGGLWHTPERPMAWLNEGFDRAGLEYLAAGDMEGWAAMFDSYEPGDDPSQYIGKQGIATTGLPGVGGPQYGTRESLCWIAAGAVVQGSPTTVVDYVPVYSAPVGNAFAFCEL